MGSVTMVPIGVKQLIFSISLVYVAVFIGPTRIVQYLAWAWTDPDFFRIPACVGYHCMASALACMANPDCKATLDCITECQLTQPRSKQAMCAYICEVTDGYMNPEFEETMLCMIDGQCMSHYPQDGRCLATDEDTVQSITDMSQVAGEWWAIKGVNCGLTEEYPGGYDWFPCQHERWSQREDGSWFNSISFCAGKDSQCISRGGGAGIKTIANATMNSPGVITHTYDSALSPQVEHWRIVSHPHPDYMLVLWCGKIPIQEYNGGLLFSRKRNDLEMSEQVRNQLREAAAKHGLEFDQMCSSDNSWCPS